MKGLILQKTLFRVLIVLCLVSALSVSAFASGTSTTPAYPNSTYTYVTGLSTTGTVQTSTGTYFDAVTQSFKGIGNILAALRTQLVSIKSNTDYISAIKTDTANVGTISTYTKSNNTLLTSINTGINDLESAINSKAGAWTSTQASDVTSDVALLESYGKSLVTTETSSNTYLFNLTTKVATESTLQKVATEATQKTLAKEVTVSSILSVLSDIKPNISTITSKITDLADVLASPEDKELHDTAKGNVDYINNNNDLTQNISDSSKFDSASSGISGISSFLTGDNLTPSGDFSTAFELINSDGFSFWSSSTYKMIHPESSSSSSSGQSRARSRSVYDPVSDLPYDPVAEFEAAFFEFGSDE